VSLRCVDADGDGACDDQTWACGTAPTTPVANPIWGNVLKEAWWSHDANLALHGRFLVARAGASVALALKYDWRVDCPSSPCEAQLEVGLLATGMTQLAACAADKPMGQQIDWTQTGTVMLTIPTTSGVYDVRLNIAKQAACGGSLTGTPAANQTVAKICVP